MNQTGNARRGSPGGAIASAKREFDLCLERGEVDRALVLFAELKDRGARIESARLKAFGDRLHAEKRWTQLASILEQLIDQEQAQLNGLRLTLAQVCVKKLQQPDDALEALAATDHRTMTPAQRDLAMEMMSRARQLRNIAELAGADAHDSTIADPPDARPPE